MCPSRAACAFSPSPRRWPRSPPLAFTILVNNTTAGAAEVQELIDTFVSALARHAGWTQPPR